MTNIGQILKGLELDESVLSKNKPERLIEGTRQAGNLLFVSGHGPTDENGEMAFLGRVGGDLTLEEAREAARLCTLGCLGAIKEALGSLMRIDRIIRVRGFVSSADGFHDQPEVMNAASELLLAVFGDAGRHVRTAIGTSVLPGNIPVEIDMVVALKSEDE